MKNYKIYMETSDKKLEIEVTKEIENRTNTIFSFFINDIERVMVTSKKIPKEPFELMMYFLKHQTSKKLKVII